jgi:hypothetical protein
MTSRVPRVRTRRTRPAKRRSDGSGFAAIVVADRDRVRPIKLPSCAARGEEQRRQLADDAPVGLLREGAEQVVRRDPACRCTTGICRQNATVRRRPRSSPAVDHDRGRSRSTSRSSSRVSSSRDARGFGRAVHEAAP